MSGGSRILKGARRCERASYCAVDATGRYSQQMPTTSVGSLWHEKLAWRTRHEKVHGSVHGFPYRLREGNESVARPAQEGHGCVDESRASEASFRLSRTAAQQELKSN